MAITATLRTASTDAKVQKAAAASVASAPTAAPKPVAPKTATPKPVTRPAAPVAVPAAAPKAAAPATPPTASAAQRSTLRKAVTRPTAPATKAAEAPVIDVQSEVVQTETPVAEVKVESVNTVAAPAPGKRVSVGAGSTASVAAEVAAPEPEPTPEPEPAPSYEEVVQQGYDYCRSGAQEPVTDASEAFIEGWNKACAEIAAELEQAASLAAEAPAEQEQTQAVAHRPPSSLGRRINYSDGESFIGDWSSEDLKFPQLKIVQGSGPLSAMFNEGTVIYNDIELLPPAKLGEGVKNPVLRFIPVQIVKQYREKLSDEEQKAGAIPRIANSVAEVEEKGGVTTYGGSDTQPDNYWQASGKCLFLIEQPEVEPGKDHPSFVLELDGKLYAVAIYYAAGNAWRNAGKQIFNVARTSLLIPKLDEAGQPVKDAQGRVVKRACAYKNFWSMGFVKKPSGEYIVWQPAVKLLAKEPTGPELRAYCDSLISGGNDASVASETE